MELLTVNTPMTQELVQRGLLLEDPFTLIDIGCSGGLHPAWRVFADHLRAVGVEPMLAECARLQREEQNLDVKYRPCFMGLPRDHPFVTQRHTSTAITRWQSAWLRLSTCAAVALCETHLSDPEQCEPLNAWHKQTLADANVRIGLRQLGEESGFETIDLLKLDTDGDDFEILQTCEDTFERFNVLGVMLEVNYFGTEGENDHTFHNTDRFLRRHGFSLFGLSVKPYSRRDLPAPFRYSFPGMTTFGAPLQGDAIYLRDLADSTQAVVAARVPDTKLLKLAALYEIFNLPDCAAETLNHFAGRLERATDLESLRDLLVPHWLPEPRLRYREYLEFFNKNINTFLVPPPAPPPPPRRNLVARTLGYVRRRISGFRIANNVR